MGEWQKVPIGSVASVFDGPHATPKTIDVGPIFLGIGALQNGRINLSETRHVSPDDFTKWTRRTKPGPGDVVFSYETRIGEVAMIPEGMECCLGRRMALVRPMDERLDSRFFLYYYLSPAFQDFLRSRTITGATVDRIALKAFPSFPISLPDIEEQRSIASMLGALDDKIELNRRMNETLEASARALYRDWFVDFGPTRAKAEGRPAWLAPDLWSLFPDRLGDDGVPYGWVTDVLAAVATLNPEAWGARDHPTTLSYVDLSNTKWGYIEKTESYDWADAPSRARRVLRPGDTIVGTVRPGNGSYAYIGESGLTGSTGFAVLRPTNERDRAIIWCAATSPDNIERLAHLADGGAYPAVRPEAVSSTEIQIPSSEILSAFEQLVAPLLEQIEANKIESRTLATTRDALLPKLMSGEIRVREAEALAA